MPPRRQPCSTLRATVAALVAPSFFLVPAGASAAPPPGGYDDEQPPPPPPHGDAPPPSTQPPPAQAVPAPASDPAEEPPPANRAQGRGLQYGLHLVVPVFLVANDDARMRPGIGVQGRLGWEFPVGLSIEGILGVSYNGSDANAELVDETGRPIAVGDYGLTNIWVGAGLRYAFINPTALVPFVGAGVQLNIWTDQISYAGVTESSDSSSLTFGAQANAGLIFEINENIGLEAGVQLQWTTPPADEDEFGEPIPFAGPELWLSPFFGATFYF